MPVHLPIAEPKETNWKKIDASRDKEVDPTLYKQLIRLLMYLVNTRLDICFVVNTLSQFMVELKMVHGQQLGTFLNMCVEQSDMGWNTLEKMSNWMDSQMQIGQVVQ